MPIQTIAGKHIGWDLVLLVVVAIIMSGALNSDVTGIKPAIIALLHPVLGGKGLFATAVIIMLTGFLLTHFCTNVVIGVIVLPAFGTFVSASGLGTDAVPMAICTILMIFLAFLSPAASPYAAMLYANKEWLSPGDILRFGLPFTLAAVLLYCFVGYPLAKIIM